jgi:hypothetical protein
VGLNNIKNTDWLNVVVQALIRIAPLRNHMLVEKNWEGVSLAISDFCLTR